VFAFLHFQVRHLKLKEKMFSEKQNTKNEKKKNIDFPILISKIQKR